MIKIFQFCILFILSLPLIAAEAIEPFGYGRLEHKLVKQSATGRTGQWWCDMHFGKNLGGHWMCRSVSGGNSCTATVPNDELVSCSQYSDVRTVGVRNRSAFGRTGKWWCDMHFGGNLGGDWNCLDVTGSSCIRTAPNSSVVSCGRVTSVNEAPFQPVPTCKATHLNATEETFCNLTNYMSNREQDTLYIYNDYVRAGFNRSYGGTLFELYGTDKVNRIEEHGGSALQLSMWGYGYSSIPRRWLYFTTHRCDTTAYPTHEQCRQNNNNNDCRRFPESGSHISDCVTERFCDNWTAAGPWNPMMARAENCTWNGHGNDVTQITQRDRNSISLRKVAPHNYTKTTAHQGLDWTVTGSTKNNVPYLELTYDIRNYGEATGVHNQEIPAIFLDRIVHRDADSTRLWEYSFYTGSMGYRNPNSRVTSTTYTNQQADLQLPGRSSSISQLPLPRPSKSFRATEDWLSVCNNKGECVTVASFSPRITAFAMTKYYMTAMGRFSYGPYFNDSIKLYLFPYRYDDVINGKTVRQWIYELKSQHG